MSVRSLAALSLTVALLATLAALLAPPLQAQSLTTFASSTHLSSTGSSGAFIAQSFETGANASGYTVSEVDVGLNTASGRSISGSVSDEEMGVFTSVTATIMANYAAQL